MTHFELLQTAITITGLGIFLYACSECKRYLKNYLKTNSCR